MIYDLIIVGGGPAGYLGAERASHEGLSTLLIESRNIGGVCLNEGCVPSKTLLYSAKILENARHGEAYGVTCKEAVLDHAAVIARKNKVVKTLVGGIRSQLKKNGVTVLEATGVIQGRDADGFHVLAGGESHTGRRLLIATGSAPVLPPIPGLREGIQSGFVLTNREILNLNQVPGDLTVIGGGVIGLEMASYFNSAGSRITVVEMLDHIAGNTDAEISEILLKNYTARGVQFALSSKVVAIKDHAVVYESASGTVEIPADKVLCSIGRKPVTEGVGLENIGVRLERGAVVTDERGRTNIPEVYAAGDVNGVWMLAHAAYREAEVCVNNMLGKRDTIRYNAIPSVIYTTPEVASAGETAATCAQKGILFDETTVSMMYSGRYVAENKAKDGICKILVEKDSRRLLGVHMIGSYASEIIYGAGILIETEMRVEDIRQLVFPHPTVSEIIREGIFRL